MGKIIKTIKKSQQTTQTPFESHEELMEIMLDSMNRKLGFVFFLGIGVGLIPSIIIILSYL